MQVSLTLVWCFMISMTWRGRSLDAVHRNADLGGAKEIVPMQGEVRSGCVVSAGSCADVALSDGDAQAYNNSVRSRHSKVATGVLRFHVHAIVAPVKGHTRGQCGGLRMNFFLLQVSIGTFSSIETFPVVVSGSKFNKKRGCVTCSFGAGCRSWWLLCRPVEIAYEPG